MIWIWSWVPMIVTQKLILGVGQLAAVDNYQDVQEAPPC